tara:strand:- start:1139 stop:3382 length:2244 start_codon:yes stop_codon:yes gene_type:complete
MKNGLRDTYSSYIDLVLVGGGHAQVQALKSFGMRPETGVRLTLITDVLNTPYSGMLPGYIEGIWSDQDMYINLVKLARFAGARLIHQSVKSINTDTKTIYLNNKIELKYDVLSLNCGAAPDLKSIPGADLYAVAVKPISLFLNKLPPARAISGPVCIIGAGAAGAELALAFRHRYGASADIHLIGRPDRVLPTRSRHASLLLTRALKQNNITLHLGKAVSQITAKAIHFFDETTLAYNHIFLVTSARPADWLNGLTVTKDEEGYIQVSNSLQSVSNKYIFAAGDVASISGYPREKAGVFAVRAGPVLCHNLRAFIRGKELRSWQPQRQYLALIGLGNGRALASWGPFSSAGHIWWKLKAFIDRRFMQKFSALPEMFEKAAPLPVLARKMGRISEISDAMFCAACGAKTSADTLQAALQRACEIAENAGADPDYLPHQTINTDQAEIRVPAGTLSLSQSVDYISQHISDLFCFGRIATLHALSDIFVAGHQPLSALATVILQRDHKDLQANDLAQMLAGSLIELSRHKTILVGGHTSIADHAGLGFAITGMAVEPEAQNEPDTTSAIDFDLLLTKPLGIGVILAAEMRQLCPTDSYESAVEVMLHSNFHASQIISQYPQAVMTDVTGFGLGRHALNLAQRVSAIGVTLFPEACPFITGALSLSAKGVQSSAFTANQLSLTESALDSHSPSAKLMFDPQTSGGILAAVPHIQTRDCLQRLHQAGYRHTTVVGHFSEQPGLTFKKEMRAE